MRPVLSFATWEQLRRFKLRGLRSRRFYWSRLPGATRVPCAPQISSGQRREVVLESPNFACDICLSFLAAPDSYGSNVDSVHGLVSMTKLISQASAELLV